MARRAYKILIFVYALLVSRGSLHAQGSVSVSLSIPGQKTLYPASVLNAVFWLEPINADLSNVSWPVHQPYRLIQRNRTFIPHLLVVPVGASVAFPNEDPFFHNVFSLFEGGRFDLGLYEAGTSRDVQFSRKGVSYIFCNIHPEMGAVVLALGTPLWRQAHEAGRLVISNVPAGSYEVNLWIEGQDASELTRWKHQIVVDSGGTDAGAYVVQSSRPSTHADEFGHDYRKEPRPY